MRISDWSSDVCSSDLQALAILDELRPVTGEGSYLFPGLRTAARPMSENTVNAALRRLGFDRDTMTGHGFRATARTILDERSEERRVGTECGRQCRYRWSTCHNKKKYKFNTKT